MAEEPADDSMQHFNPAFLADDEAPTEVIILSVQPNETYCSLANHIH
jgi:hypothetical protein